MRIEKISFIGCGALGIMYASHMLKSLAPRQVQFVADSEWVKIYRGHEFFANGERQNFTFKDPNLDDYPSDLVIFAVKFPDLNEAIRVAKNHVGERTIVLSFMNGITSEEIIAKTYNPQKILYSMATDLDPTREKYSVNFSKTGNITFGSAVGGQDEEIADLAEFFQRVDLNYKISKDIMAALWWKYVMNIGINQVSALLQASYGELRTEYAENLIKMTMYEAYEVALREGIYLKCEEIDKAALASRNLSPVGKTSMCQDMDAKRPTEVDMFAGAIIEMGKKHGISVPANTFLYNAIKALESQF